MLAQQIIGGSLVWCGGFLVLYKISQNRIFFVVGRCLEGKRAAGNLDHILHFLWGYIQGFGQLFHGWVTPQALGKLMLDAQQLVNLVAHVNRNPNRATLVSYCTRDRLADPPGSISTELMPAPVVKLLSGTDQTDVTFLNQIKKGYSTTHIFLGYANYQT